MESSKHRHATGWGRNADRWSFLPVAKFFHPTQTSPFTPAIQSDLSINCNPNGIDRTEATGRSLPSAGSAVLSAQGNAVRKRGREKGEKEGVQSRFFLLPIYPFPHLPISLSYEARPLRKSLPGVAPVHLPSSNVTPPLTIIQR